MIRSRPHRAVLALLRAALGVPQGTGAVEDVRRAPPQKIMAIARTHRLLAALEPPKDSDLPAALEPDALLFLQEMRAANFRRNVQLAKELTQIGATLAREGIEAVVLKGGAELIQPFDDTADRRSITDLDLLVSPERIEDAQRLLLAAGWQEIEMADIMQARHHHLPSLVHPEMASAVELHRRVGDAQAEAVLPAAELLERSEPTELAGLRMPAMVDRLVHLALHAQFSESGWEDRRLRLCDAMDLYRAFANAGAPEADAARAAFARTGQTQCFDGLLLATETLLPGRLPAVAADAPAREWAASAVARIDRPMAVRLKWLRRRGVWRLHELLASREARQLWIDQLRAPSNTPRLLEELRKKWRAR